MAVTDDTPVVVEAEKGDPAFRRDPEIRSAVCYACGQTQASGRTATIYGSAPHYRDTRGRAFCTWECWHRVHLREDAQRRGGPRYAP
jgi:hypothetical protein